MVPPASHRMSRVPWYSGTMCRSATIRQLRGSHPLRRCFPPASLNKRPPRPLPPCRERPHCPTTPDPTVARSAWFGLAPVRSPLLRGSRLISLPPGTEMFQFPEFPPLGYRFTPVVSTHDGRGVASFGFGWLVARMQLPIHVSPVSAPFFGSWPLGILPLPCSAWRSFHITIRDSKLFRWGSVRRAIKPACCVFFYATSHKHAIRLLGNHAYALRQN